MHSTIRTTNYQEVYEYDDDVTMATKLISIYFEICVNYDYLLLID